MNSVTNFTSDKERLPDLLREIKEGKLQLPEFQRGWVWDDFHIRELLSSVSMSFPIGAVMLLETGNPEVRFKARLVEGVELDSLRQPDRFILDGQQRLTSLFQSLFVEKPVVTRGPRDSKVRHWYYIDMQIALDLEKNDRDEAIVATPEDKIFRNFRGEIEKDYSSPEAEYKAHLFPLCKIFDYADWRANFNEFWEYDRKKIKLFDQFEKDVIKHFEQCLIPVIKLLKQSPKVAICKVFERVNTGGIALNVFELITATFAADEFDLRADWYGEYNHRGQQTSSGRLDRLKKQPVLHSIESTDFLQIITLLSTYNAKLKNPDTAISCKRKDVLNLTLNEYKKWAEPATVGLERVAKFLFKQKIYSSGDLPYRSQLVPLASILTILGDKWEDEPIQSKITRWYWCGVFGELYGGAIESRFAKDVGEVIIWVTGGNEPSTVNDCNFNPNRLITLKTRNSAAYKGTNALILLHGAIDLRTGSQIDVEFYFDEKIDIHHIFPASYSAKRGISSKFYDCVVNKTPLTAKTNRAIGGNAPNKYLEIFEQKHKISPDILDKIILSHLGDITSLRKNDFNSFFESRYHSLLDAIEKITGKSIARDSFPDLVSEKKGEEGLS